MPFVIVRNDITRIAADAVVNSVHPYPSVGSGVDSDMHGAAGPMLWQARQELGDIAVGSAAITPGYGLPARHVIHAAAPVWHGGGEGEDILLRQCCRSIFALAADAACESLAMPLLSAGNNGFPSDLSLRIISAEAEAFLAEHDMHITLAVFDRASYVLSRELYAHVASHIDENYVRGKLPTGSASRRAESPRAIPRSRRSAEKFSMPMPMAAADECMAMDGMPVPDLEDMLRRADAGFSERLMQLIDASGKKDSEVYKRANIDRKLFSKIRSNLGYRPSKTTAVAFAIALELSLEETRDLIARAGYALSRSSKFDIIVEYCILTGQYNVFEINAMLFDFDQPLIGG